MSKQPPDPFAATDPAAADERLGKQFGEYRLTKRIGSGGMGAVYAAEHVRLGRIAAIKVLQGDLVSDAKALQRFSAEALTVARLQHPNIVDVYDVGNQPEPHCVMELLRGRSLGAAIVADGAMNEQRALFIAAQVLGVLDVVHGRGIVHRDIKPDNIFLVDDGVRADHVKLLDFGIAKIRDGHLVGISSTTGSAMMGTPLYMSPEQIEGGPIDGRTDLYAFGLVMYEMITGRPAFAASSLTSLLSKQLLEMPPPPREFRGDLSSRFEEVILRCVAKRPEDRFASAGEVLRALDLTSARSVLMPNRQQNEQRTETPRPADRIGALSTLGRASGEVARNARAATLPTGRKWIGFAVGTVAVAAVVVSGSLLRTGTSHVTPTMTAAAPPAPLPPPVQPATATTADLLARAAALLAAGDAAGALEKSRAAVAAGAGREGWMLMARAACATRARAELREAESHLSKSDAALAARDCPSGHKSAATKRSTTSTVTPANGAPILE